MLKCLVFDLDNTIWGGVVGEDGVEGIRLTHEYLEVQRAALDLRNRGILLAICSKNDITDAWEALARPDMVLDRWTDFAATRINWQDKTANLREIAAQINIGLDSLAFVDDSPTERGLVKAQLPDVTVIDLPNDPAGYAAAIRAVFPDGAVTEEDKKRSGYYSEQKRRMEAEQQAASREEFLHSLGLELEVGRATSETIPRIAQLSQRTNQFTLTGRKYSEEEIAALCEDGQHNVYWGRLRDRFGDYGIIAAAVVWVGTSCYEDFYLSCRAMGRDVETAFLLATMIEGEQVFVHPVATGRNAPAQQFFHSRVEAIPIKAPPWIKTHFVCQTVGQHPDRALGRIRAIAADVFGLTPSDLSSDSSPANIPEWDSFGAINLMLALEDEFGIVFTAEEMEIAPTLGQIAEMIHAKRGACDRRPNSLP